MASWLENLAKVGLITLYQVDGKEYLRVTKWEQHQHIRTKRHRYPLPATDSNKPQDIAATLDNLLQAATVCNNLQQSVANGGELQQVAASCSNPLPESLSLSESNPYPNPNPILTDSLPKHRSIRQR
jgi:hypothetical protein